MRQIQGGFLLLLVAKCVHVQFFKQVCVGNFQYAYTIFNICRIKRTYTNTQLITTQRNGICQNTQRNFDSFTGAGTHVASLNFMDSVSIHTRTIWI
jgi:hypothetical protein